MRLLPISSTSLVEELYPSIDFVINASSYLWVRFNLDGSIRKLTIWNI